ncbi:MAG: c-type cytochrome [Proteobacteria bacterium]|nr:c-type cytochrome [Pseudomonadota bacterium]
MFRLASAFVVLAAATLVACSVSVNYDSGDQLDLSGPDQPEQVAGYYGVGKAASPEEIAGWDIDIRPDGLGLPDGSASAEDGEMLYEDQCAVCHGSFGEGVDRYPVLAGGEGTLTEFRPEKTVGSYWPYASTLWDYIHRAMPFAAPQSLSDQEVYAITAYVLYLNDLVDYEFVLTRDNLASIEMPNRDGFFVDDRPDTSNEACMNNCKDAASIRITSEPELVVDVSPVVKSTAARVYEQACAVCHAIGVGSAPIPGDNAEWSKRIGKGRDELLSSALFGIGIMPAKGGHAYLSDDEVASAVDFMIELERSFTE